jgi:UDP-N-acetylglucosamine:LPS N-acetylglucosamine transferase
MENKKKPRVVFPFVEAGMGHIMPMRAVSDAFEKKYGDRVEIIKTYFFQDTNDPNMKFVEDELIREVKGHNKNWFNSFYQFLLLSIFRTRISMKFLHQVRYKRGFEPSMRYLKSLDADLIFNTHFSTLYYACELRARGQSKSKIITFCPDPIVGLQWDNRGDLMLLSGSSGVKKAQRFGRLKPDAIKEVPFLIRKEVQDYNKGKEFYRRELGIPQDNFTILLADGAYGAGKLKDTVYELLKSKLNLTLIAVCGKNQELYEEFQKITPPSNIVFKPYGFTDKMLMFAASCDLFIGKAGASNLAEPAYFGAPCIVTFCATPIEKWICQHYTSIGCAIRIKSVKKAVVLAESFAQNPELMEPYVQAAKAQSRCDGADILADIIYEQLHQ